MKSIIDEALEGNNVPAPAEDVDELESFPPIRVLEPIAKPTEKVDEIDTNQDTKDDYVHARDVAHNLLEQQQEAVKSMIRFINECPSARGYEVLNQMMKTAQEMANNLMELQKQVKDNMPVPVKDDDEEGDGNTKIIILASGPGQILEHQKAPIDITPKDEK